jgi:gamma-glutamyl phosphate reductase
MGASNADANRRKKGAMARGPAPGGSLAQLCGERAERFTQLPVQRIEQTLKITQKQEDALGELKTASANAGDMLKTSCPAQVPQSLVDRIDAMQQRLDSMMQAVSTVRPALDNFYASLNDEQKARFNMIGGLQNPEARQR